MSRKLRTVRKVHKLVPAVALALAAQQASAQVLYEPFKYTSGVVLDTDAASASVNFSSSGTFWAKRGSQTGDFTVGAGLTAPSAAGVVLPANMGNAALYPSAGTGRTPALGFGQIMTSGDVYYSLQLKAPTGTLGSTAGFLAGLTNFSIPTSGALSVPQAALRYQVAAGNTYQIGIQNANASTANFAPATFSSGDTVFVVARYRIVAGAANDLLDLWVNPTSGFGDNSAIPAASVTQVTNNNDAVDSGSPSLPCLAGFFMRSFSSVSGFEIDEVRVDNTWAGVTPDGTKQFTFNNVNGGNWSDPNWNDYLGAATANNPNALGHVANFGANINSGSTITVDAAKTVDTINFTNAGSLIVTGQPITFSSNASAAQVYVYAGNHTLNAPVTMSSNLSIKTQAGASITLGGAVTGAGKTLGIYGRGTVKLASSNLIDDAARLEVRSGTLDLNGNSEIVDVLQLGTSHPNNGTAIPATYNGDLASGTISNGTITANSYELQSGIISATVAGTNGVVKNLSGFVTFSGANTYSGNTTVNSGQLTLTGTNSNTVIGVINPPPAISGAVSTLAVTSDAALGPAPVTPTTVLTINPATTGGAFGINEDIVINANRTLNILANSSRIAVASGKTATFAGLITGSGGLTNNGPGTLVLTHINDYTGTTTFGAGTLLVGAMTQLGTGTTLAFNGGTMKESAALGDITRAISVGTAGGTMDTNGFDTTFSGAMTGTTSSNLIKAGSGALSLTGANGGYAGKITINTGSVRVTSNTDLGATASPGITDISGGSNTGTLEFDATLAGGNLTIDEPIGIHGRDSAGAGNTAAHVNTLSGNTTLTQPLTMDTGGTLFNIRSDAGKLTLSAINNPISGATGRTINLRGTGTGEITNGINNSGAATAALALSKFDSGTWTLGGPNTLGGAITVNAGNLVVNTSLTNYTTSSAVTVAGGKLTLAADGTATRVIRTGAVATTGGTLDIGDGKLITTTAVGTATAGVYDGVSGQIQAGRNGGGWGGATGIVTSQSNATSGNFTSVGVASASQVKGIAATDTAVFAGQTVTGSDTLVMYTYGGDANLDGKINVDDYGHIDSSIPIGLAGWFNGDFNYDGKINVDDYGIIDFNIGIQGAQFPTGAGAGGGLSSVAAVPEPAAGMLLLLGASLAAGTRRRRRLIS